ncbi:MAG: putative acyl-CoA dehydrogenase YngJ [Candidatus Thorarchaeota archaeon]|nr:MAG: putative acyl-CoA dehydrogenase YngJ [Candidatus Thorarchaeota archaeon]
MVDFSLTDEQIELQKKARDFAQEYMIPYAHHYDKTGDFPLPIIRKCWEQGLMNLGIPKDYGGPGWGALEQCLVVEEMAAGCAGMTTSIYVNSLGAEPILVAGSDEQKEKYLPPLVEDLKFISFACSEPYMGSDVAGIRTRVKKEGSNYVLNGSKFWITNAPYADYFTVFASLDPSKRHKALCAFIVEADMPGVKTGPPVEKMGHRASVTSSVILRDVKVPEENILGSEGMGFLIAMQTFAMTRPAIAAFATGLARAAMEYAREYTEKREAFTKKLREFQAIQFKLAEMYMKIEASRALYLKAAWTADTTGDSTVPASVAKAYATDAAMEVASEALQIHGGYGYIDQYPLEKLFRDAKLYQIYEGTSEIQRLILGRHVLDGYDPAMEDIPKWGLKDAPDF